MRAINTTDGVRGSLPSMHEIPLRYKSTEACTHIERRAMSKFTTWMGGQVARVAGVGRRGGVEVGAAVDLSWRALYPVCVVVGAFGAVLYTAAID